MNYKILIISIIILAVIASVSIYIYNGGKIITVEPNLQENQNQTPTQYTMSDVSLHNTESNCWMAINQKVYNVTEYISFHPGGKAILRGCGKDATDLFENRPTNSKGPHPEQAREKLNTYYIGDLKI